MKTILLAAGVAAIALSGGQALAAHKTAVVAGPKQPIPYAQLKAYLKASPKQRAAKDWWSGQNLASAGAASTNASATATAGSDVRSTPDATPTPAPATPDAATPPTSATLPGDTPSPGPVNPPAATPPGSPPSATPPK